MRRKITPDMSKAALDAVDWAAMDAVTDSEIEHQIAADADVAPEILPVDVKAIRSATGLSQGLFAARYRIPVPSSSSQSTACGEYRSEEKGSAREILLRRPARSTAVTREWCRAPEPQALPTKRRNYFARKLAEGEGEECPIR